jgi:type II secretory pathway component PulM
VEALADWIEGNLPSIMEVRKSRNTPVVDEADDHVVSHSTRRAGMPTGSRRRIE